MERRASDVIRDDHGVLHGDRFGEIAREMIRWSETWTTAPTGDRWDVALVTPQTGEALAAVTGLAVAGWAVGVVDPGWTPAEQQAAVHQLDPSAVVVPADQGVTGQRLVVAGWRPVMHPNGAWIALLPPGREGGMRAAGTDARHRLLRRLHLRQHRAAQGVRPLPPVVA